MLTLEVVRNLVVQEAKHVHGRAVLRELAFIREELGKPFVVAKRTPVHNVLVANVRREIHEGVRLDTVLPAGGNALIDIIVTACAVFLRSEERRYCLVAGLATITGERLKQERGCAVQDQLARGDINGLHSWQI